MEHGILTAGIDIGTTTISFTVIRDQEQHIAYNIPNQSGTGATQNADWITDAVRAEIDHLLERYHISAIGFTGQMHGIVLFNSEGNAESPLYTWESKIGQEYAAKIGIPSGYGINTLYALSRMRLLPEPATSFCTIADYVVMRLIGGKNAIVHASMAASFGAYDIKNKWFDIDKIRELGLSDTLLPKTTADTQLIGYYRGIPVAIPIGDHQASVLAIGSEEGTVCINCGTGSQISAVVTDIDHHIAQEIRPFIDRKYLLTGAALCGGRAYALLEEFFGEYARFLTGKRESQYELMNYLASQATDRLDVDTRFNGTRENEHLRGSINGISTHNFTPQALTAGFLYGIAQELKNYYDIMDMENVPVIYGSGNGIRKNPQLQRIIEQVFGTKLNVPEILEEAAYGAAIFAQRCLTDVPKM